MASEREDMPEPSTELKAHDNGSLTLDNASVQRLMEYGLLHHTDEGWHVGKWPQTNRPAPYLGDDGELVRKLRQSLTELRDSQSVPIDDARVEVAIGPLCDVLCKAPDAIDRITELLAEVAGLRELLSAGTPSMTGSTVILDFDNRDDVERMFALLGRPSKPL